MLSEEQGNILDAPADALVNTVNTVGVMGKGLALQFKQAYPGNFRAYRSACQRGEVQVGSMFVYETGQSRMPRFVINFPTKTHWRSNSRLDHIRAGLDDLRKVIIDCGIRSVAIPPLGCGNGGLSWQDVRPLIIDALGDLPGVRVLVYPPQGSPPAKDMPVRTSRPPLTIGRAALLSVISNYVRLSMIEEASTVEGASLLEIQKLTYFLQEAGQPLRLTYAKGHYGPYAEKLNHVLQVMEGHYLRGYGDRTNRVLDLSPLLLLPGAGDAARARLDVDGDEKSLDRISAVTRLVTGFASPYGVELLATVHWTATREAPKELITDPVALTKLIRRWNERKGRLFTEAHIRKAADRLKELDWVTA